jgi:hypothetical protein
VCFEMRRSRKKGPDAYSSSTPVTIELKDIASVVDMVHDEAMQVVSATNHLPIFYKNVDSAGHLDTQCAVEDILENYLHDKDPHAARELYEKNLVKSLMRNVYVKYPNSKLDRAKKKIQDHARDMSQIAKWEGGFRFFVDTDDPQKRSTLAEIGAELGFMDTAEAEARFCREFAEMRPALSRIVQWFTPGGSSESAEVAKPKKKQPQDAPTKKAKTANCSEQVERGYHVEGVFKDRWVPGYWDRMNDVEKMEYRAQRKLRGNWPSEIPLCDQWINSPDGQLFKMFRTLLKLLGAQQARNGLVGLLASVGSTRHSAASSERDDRELQETNEENLLLKAEKAVMKKELDSLYCVADNLRELWNEGQEHHESQTVMWQGKIKEMNLLLSVAVACIPEDKVEIKNLLKPLEVPETTKKPRLPSTYLMDKCSVRPGLITVQRSLEFEDADDETPREED